MLVGFTPSDGERLPTLLWRRGMTEGTQPAAAHVGLEKMALVHGRVIVTYDDLRDVHHVQAIDAATGVTLWDEETPSFLDLRATPSRVYVLRWSRLDVRDAATGALLGGVGAR